jgi:hypothetical protein
MRGGRFRLAVLLAAAAGPAGADFSYVRTTSSSGSAAQTTKQYLKGQKLRMEHGDIASVVDLTAGTVTTIDRRRRIYTVHNLPAGSTAAGSHPAPQTRADIRESGKKKKIGAYNAKEVVLTMDAGKSPITGKQMQLEAEIWLSDVPGMRELQAFQRKGSTLSPASAAINGDMRQTMAELQQKAAGLDGLPVLQIAKIKPSKDGPAMMEVTTETSGFSTAPLPDSLFAVPAGYRKLGVPAVHSAPRPTH